MHTSTGGIGVGKGRNPYTRRMAEWIYFIHPPRENFGETMTGEEQAVFWRSLFTGLACGAVILVLSPLITTMSGCKCRRENRVLLGAVPMLGMASLSQPLSQA